MEKSKSERHEIPNLVLICSGKRKSGKDYIYEKISGHMQVHSNRVVTKKIVLSSELKKIYAHENNLDYEKLLDSSDYKETYRLDMIRWSDSKRAENPWYFCRKTIEAIHSADIDANRFILWIVTDARRKTDLDFFKANFAQENIKTIRVVADDAVRIQRNWTFTSGVDDSISECDLDDIKDWDFIVSNNNDLELEESLRKIYNFLERIIK